LGNSRGFVPRHSVPLPHLRPGNYHIQANKNPRSGGGAGVVIRPGGGLGVGEPGRTMKLPQLRKACS
jgi:hypothetical protein